MNVKRKIEKKPELFVLKDCTPICLAHSKFESIPKKEELNEFILRKFKSPKLVNCFDCQYFQANTCVLKKETITKLEQEYEERNEIINQCFFCGSKIDSFYSLLFHEYSKSQYTKKSPQDSLPLKIPVICSACLYKLKHDRLIGLLKKDQRELTNRIKPGLIGLIFLVFSVFKYSHIFWLIITGLIIIGIDILYQSFVLTKIFKNLHRLKKGQAVAKMIQE